MTSALPQPLSETSVVDVWSDPHRTLTFFKGRVALYGVLKAAGIGQGDEVLVPGFTCFVVPAAICYAGATPKFYDINPRQLNGDPNAAAAMISGRTRVLIVQHTFGVPADLGSLVDLCRAKGILLVEDCAHALGATLNGKQIGTLGDAAFASLQWSKPVTTGLGGIARVNHPDLYQKLRVFHDRECIEPSWQELAFLSAASSAYSRHFRPSWFWRTQQLYRFLGSIGLVRGSSDPTEFRSPTIPPGYAKTYGRSRASRLDSALQDLPRVMEHRRSIAKIYGSELRSRGVFLQEEPAGSESVPLRVPIRVRDREALLFEARRNHIELGDWFNAPLHPAAADHAAFGYEQGSCPHAERAAKELVNLPTHGGVDEEAAIATLNFLRISRHVPL